MRSSLNQTRKGWCANLYPLLSQQSCEPGPRLSHPVTNTPEAWTERAQGRRLVLSQPGLMTPAALVCG